MSLTGHAPAVSRGSETEGLCNGEEEKNSKTGGNVCRRKPRNEKKVRKREKKEKRDRTLRTDRNM